MNWATIRSLRYTRSMVKEVRDDFAATTRKANKIAATVSLIYTWGHDAELVPDGSTPRQA
jgi:hypothetical protein